MVSRAGFDKVAFLRNSPGEMRRAERLLSGTDLEGLRQCRPWPIEGDGYLRGKLSAKRITGDHPIGNLHSMAQQLVIWSMREEFGRMVGGDIPHGRTQQQGICQET